MKKITVVTVTFNSAEETHNLLTSLKKVEKKDFILEVIIVDNNSKVPFILYQSEQNPHTFLTATSQNLGFTGGYNWGIKKALEQKADYLVLLNNDTLVDPKCFEEFLATAESDSKIGIVVPKIYFAKGHEFHKDRYTESEKGKVFWYAGGYMDWANVFSRHRGVDEVDKGQYDQEEAINFATGCCLFVPAEVIKKIGGFDDELFLYFEDADFSQRVLQKGFKIIYQPKAVIWHVNAASGGGSGSILHDYYITRNRMLFGMRYAPFRSKIALIKESLRLLFNGREWQKKGIRDFYWHRWGKGSFAL